MRFFLASSFLIARTSTTAVQGAYVAPTTNYDRCVTQAEADDIAAAIANGVDVELFPEKIAPDQSSYWEMEYHGTYKILKNTQDTINTQYLLYQCGLPMPLNETELANFDSVLPVPFDGGLVVTATTQIPNIEILGRRRQISAFAVTENLVSSPCLSQVLIPEGKENGSITMLPLYNDTALEEYISTHPDSLILGGSWDSAPKMKNKVVISDVGEDPQRAIDDGVDINEATAEWLEVIGSLFNQEKVAHEYNEQRRQRYECHKQNAEQLALALEDSVRPKVLWGYYYADITGFDAPSSPNYYVTYAQHCQADLLIPAAGKEGSIDSWGYKYMNDDEWLEFGKEADFWIYPSDNFNQVLGQKYDYLQQFKAVQNKQVYDYQMSGGEGWFERRLAEYDVVLLDACQVLGRNVETFPPHQRKWLRNVFTESPGTLGVCTDADEPFEARHTECVRRDEELVTEEGDETTVADTKQPSSASKVELAQAIFASMTLMWTVNA